MLLDRIKTLLRTGLKFPGRRSDTAGIKINGLLVTMTRQNVINVPHEFTVVVPRVEIRKKYYLDNQLLYEEEMIFNSLTIVHAPRHEPGEKTATISFG